MARMRLSKAREDHCWYDLASLTAYLCDPLTDKGLRPVTLVSLRPVTMTSDEADEAGASDGGSPPPTPDLGDAG